MPTASNPMTKEMEIGGNRVVVLDGLEKLKTMNCDNIENLLFDAYCALHRNGQHLMAQALNDLVSPIRKERERAEYNWVLASDLPGYDNVYICPLSDFPGLKPKPKDLYGQESVLMKRVKKQ
jgi:hypothetical protein